MKLWLSAARPKTLLASVAPVAIGTSLAVRDERLHAPTALACLAGALAIQVGTNFCNDYFDFQQGADTAERKGPRRYVQSGLISPKAMLIASCLMFAVAAGIGGWLAVRAGWWFAVIAMASIVCGVWYTAGRNSLAYLGIADAFVIVFFGPIAVGGTYAAQALHLPWTVLVAGLAPGLIATGLLVVNNLRDEVEDRMAGKRTLVVRFGPRLARWQFALMLILAATIPWILWWKGSFPASILLACLFIIPGIRVIRDVWNLEGTALNRCLGATAGLLGLYTIVFCSVCCLLDAVAVGSGLNDAVAVGSGLNDGVAVGSGLDELCTIPCCAARYRI